MAKPKCTICRKRVATHRNLETPENLELSICHKCRAATSMTETERFTKECGKQTLYP